MIRWIIFAQHTRTRGSFHGAAFIRRHVPHPLNRLCELKRIARVNQKTILTIKGLDKYLVGQVSDNIRALRKPEPYKGKGIKYKGEQILRKEGKTGKK